MGPDEKRLIQIIERMPNNLTDMQKARYIYIEACRFFIYNPEYIIGNDQKRANLFFEDIDINNIINNKAICSTISRAVIYLLQQCQIECNGVYFNGKREGHMEVAFKIDGKVYEMNPVADLMNIKVGYETIRICNANEGKLKN
ncbi:MAG: hypothetical protein IJH12_06135 [Clostridia bacterium]|nr:hypothetical protein [Clostridia bacterium]